MGQKFWAIVCALSIVAMLAPQVAAADPTGDNPFSAGPAPAGAAAEAEAASTGESQPAGDAGPIDVAAAESRIERVLDRPLREPLSFSSTPLNQVTEQLSATYDIPIVFDVKALDAIASSPEVEVSISLANVSLRSALELMLGSAEDLTYLVDREVLQITTEEEASKRLVTRMYPVADLAVDESTGEVDFDTLIDAILRTVQLESWSDNGTGEGQAYPISPGILVVSQSARVHRELDRFFLELRRTKESLKNVAAADPDERPRVVTRGFAVDEQLSATVEARNMLTEIIAKSVDWQREDDDVADDEMFIHVLHKRVVVRHSPEVIAQVRRVVAELQGTPRGMGMAGGSAASAVDRGGGPGGGGSGMF